MLYPFLKFMVRTFCKLVLFVKLVGKENVPEEGAVILAVNHTSLWDPPVLISCTKRPMRTMAKKELFSNKLLGAILTMSGAFPVDRESNDITAVKTALKALKDGEIFTIYPSGKRIKGDEGADAKAGVALIASRSGVPVVPVNMKGGYRLFRRVTITFGEPMEIVSADGKRPSSEELKAFADRVMERIESLGA